MSSITLFAHQHFTGRKCKFLSNVPDLSTNDFDKSMSSVKVEGKPWVIYKENKYTGNEYLYTDGKYPQIPDDEKFSSMRLVKEDLSNPVINVYEKPFYDGQSYKIDKDTVLPFGFRVGSYVVESGAWCLYEHLEKAGKMHVAFKGEEVSKHEDIHFSSDPASLEPVNHESN